MGGTREYRSGQAPCLLVLVDLRCDDGVLADGVQRELAQSENLEWKK